MCSSRKRKRNFLKNHRWSTVTAIPSVVFSNFRCLFFSFLEKVVLDEYIDTYIHTLLLIATKRAAKKKKIQSMIVSLKIFHLVFCILIQIPFSVFAVLYWIPNSKRQYLPNNTIAIIDSLNEIRIKIENTIFHIK